MSQLEIRPRFHRHSPLGKEEVLQRLRLALDESGAPLRGFIVDHHATLMIPGEERHFWSPQLSLEVEPHEGGSLIRGLYGPSPTVWLMFLFFYAALAFVSLIIMIIGFSERSLGMPGHILWLLPVAAFFTTMVYLTARIGQRLGREEMTRLQEFLDRVLS